MHEYVKPVKDSVFKSGTDKKISKINNREIPCKNVTGDLFDNVRVQRKSEEPLQLQAPAYSQGASNLKYGLSFQNKMKNVAQLKPIADCNSTVVQFRIDGIGMNEWLDKHGLTGKKRDLFAEFFDMVHTQSEFIFFEHELDSYYEQYKNETYSDISRDNLLDFDSFKKHVAMLRDPDGAHGAQRHTHEPQAGSQYIVDRVLAPGGPGVASYLPLDTYLQWDNKLIMHHEEIFEKYMELVRDLIYGAIPTIELYIGDAAGAKAAITGLEESGIIKIAGLEVLTLSVSFAPQSLTIQGNDFQVKVPASIRSNHPVPSMSVSRADASAYGIHGVQQGHKNPEAHTGGQAPVFTVEDGQIVNEEAVTSDMLKWVTKF